jgi:hypothetical protein
MAEIVLDHTTGCLLPRASEGDIALLPDCSAPTHGATVVEN